MANPVTLWVFPIMTVYSPSCNVHRETDDKWLDLRLSQKRHTQNITKSEKPIQLSPPKIWFFNEFKMTATATCRFSAFPPQTCSAWPRNKADQPRCSAGYPTNVQRSAGFGAGERMHLRPLGDRGCCCMESPCPRKSNLKIRWFFCELTREKWENPTLPSRVHDSTMQQGQKDVGQPNFDHPNESKPCYPRCSSSQ